MRLRTRLTLAFFLFSLLPAGLVAWATLSSVRKSFESMLEKRLDDIEALVRAETERMILDLNRTVTALATVSPQVKDIAVSIRTGEPDPSYALPLAEHLMTGRQDLQILFLLDENGKIISSGHLPARFGDSDPALASIAEKKAGTPFLHTVEIRKEERIEKSRAVLVAGRAVFRTGRPSDLYVIGGRLLDDDFALRLAELTGSGIRLVLNTDKNNYTESSYFIQPDSSFISITEVAGSGIAGTRRLSPVADSIHMEEYLEIAVSEPAFLHAEKEILLVLIGTSAAAVLAAILIAGFLASRITRPVDALAGGSKEIAAGNYDVEIKIPATGEISSLVSAFNKMTVEIRNSRKKIASAERIAAWQDIARRLAHEIKNPLTPISMSIETLRRTWKKQHPDFEEIFDESTSAILEEVQSLKRLVNEFSRFARLPSPSMERLEPSELVENALALFPEPPEGMLISRSLHDNLPPLKGDKDQLGQVLMNLITNSMQALLEAGTENPQINIRAYPEGEDGIIIEVEDNGPGIADENIKEIFTPYFTTKETGSGLGLAICHRIISEHGGQIEVHSGKEKGAVFRIFLPAFKD